MSSSTNAIPEPYSGKYEGSFAYLTIRDRLPVILTKVIDSLCRDKHVVISLYGEKAKEETKDVIGYLSALQNEMVTNKLIKKLIINDVDTDQWNAYLEKEIEKSDFSPAWFDSAWLYVECYLYRRIKQAFQLSSTLQHYDPFRQQKEDAFLSSLDASLILASTLEQALSETAHSEDKLQNYFFQFLELSLWGNKCDLSISAGKEKVQITDPLSHLKQLRSNILVNDSQLVFDTLCKAKEQSPNEVILDLVLDNSGFELFSDFIFLHFLMHSQLITRANIYVKRIPWFVSDTLTEDIQWLLKTLSSSGKEVLVNCSNQWQKYIDSQQWVVEVEKFWTLPHDYSEMQSTDSQLYSKLSQSSLIVFKGDLNYRKLTADLQWTEDTPFVTSLRGFLPASLVSLRTVKADVLVGLQPGTTEKLDQKSKNWKFSGDFAVIQCADRTSQHSC